MKPKHKRRYCRHEGCTNIVKSQGLCQRHGAKPKMCKVANCKKQAQGNFDGMCKSHFKAHKRTTTPLPPKPTSETPPPPSGSSVYDDVIPASIAWNASMGTPMPLIAHLKNGFENPNQPPAWHRNEERRARGMWPVHNPATQLESWERELVWAEILLLTGSPDASFRHLARGWGRDKGFHTVLAQFICERRGNVERKKRRKTNDGGSISTGTVVAEDVSVESYDDAMYSSGAAYNEELAAGLFSFESAPKRGGNERMFSFEDGIVSIEDDEAADAAKDNENYVPVVLEAPTAV